MGGRAVALRLMKRSTNSRTATLQHALECCLSCFAANSHALRDDCVRYPL